MKRFHNITQLKLKEQQLMIRNFQLERLIREDWKDIKTALIHETISSGKSMLVDKLAETIKGHFSSKQKD
jgi:hypothetical protein